FFIISSIAVQTPGNGISNLLVVGTTFTGSGNNIHWQWELILPVGTLSWQIVNGAVQIIAPTTAEQMLAKKNELKARGTLLMAFLGKYQLKFNIHKDAKTLMEAIEKRLQKLISQLDILCETISQEDINLKFLRSLPSEWKTHTLIWRNKANLEEQSLDDLFNNFKIYEAEVKGSSPSSQNTQNIAFVSLNNTDSTNESVNAIPSVSAASSKATISTLPNVDSLSDVVIYSFFANAMLTMRARRFLKRTVRNLGENGTDTIGFDMSKVECYNCHRRGHFSRECRSPRDNTNKDTPRRTIPVEVSTLNALVSQCDAVGGYDWSFQADEEPTNFVLMAYTSSGSSSSSRSDNKVAPCSKACSKAYVTLQTHYDNLIVEFRKSQFDVLSYKKGLESVEARLVVYQQNETVFKDDIKLLKLDVMLRDNALVELRKKFKKVEKERDELKLTLDKFQTSSKNLKLHSHESDNSVPTSPENDRYKTGEGYYVPPPPYTKTFMPLKLDLVFNDAPNASESVANVFNVKSSTNKPNETECESVPKQKEPSFVLTSEHVKTPRESVKKVKHPKQDKNLKTNNHQSRVRMTHPHSNRNVVPTSVLTRSRLVSLNAARPVPTAVPQSTMKSPRPVKHAVNNTHSPIKRPINHRPATINSNFNKKVTTVKVNKVNAAQGNKGNAEKASANWLWKPKCIVLDHVSKLTSASMTLEQFNYTDALGRSNSTLKKSIEDILHLEGILKVVRLQVDSGDDVGGSMVGVVASVDGVEVMVGDGGCRGDGDDLGAAVPR
nr:hypothetical protein [Tanacetum cinerariifolium]